ncbi:hypothetical protein [Agathobacter sp.]|uniref:hypothetical protein n=1 Tax=Agathobacter sp. TaxID=2021311 RepID=UPI003AB237A4
MNKKFLKHYMETNPEGTAQTYIFLVDNQDIALNIVMSGYQALCLVQEDDGYYFSADSWFTIGILGLLFTVVLNAIFRN